MITNEEIIFECQFVRETLSALKQGQRVFERSMSISPSPMPCTNCNALWIAIRDSSVQMYINSWHVLVGKGSIDNHTLNQNNGITSDHVLINHSCIEDDADLFQYRLMYPASTISIEAIQALRELAAFAREFITFNEKPNSVNGDSVFSTSFVLYK